jgi:hypothetical protein
MKRLISHPIARVLLVVAIALVPIAAVLIGATQPTIDQPQITAAARAAIHELHASAALPDGAAAKGGMSPAAVASVRTAAVTRLQDVATGQALTMLTKNLDALLEIQKTGTSQVITDHQFDAFIVDLVTTTPTDAEVKGREHGFVQFQDPATGKTDRAQSWEYFDVTLVKTGGRWLASNVRVIPTLSDDPGGVPPYPPNGDPAE